MRIASSIRAITIAAMLTVAGTAPATPPPPPSWDGSWHAINGNSDEQGFSYLSHVTPQNVGQLGLAWYLDLPGETTLQAAPIVVDGVLYFTGSCGAVYAVNGLSGKIVWRFDPRIWEHNPLKMNYGFCANRGVAYDNGKIFSAALDGRLFALDARTGAKLWETETTDPKSGQTVTGAPRVFRGKVIIGQGGADFGMRGYVSAYDQQTGKQAWKFHVVPSTDEANRGDAVMEMAAKTWSGTNFKANGGGGGPWDSITFDAEMNRIYVGTANAYDYDPDKRSPGGGDNLFTASIVALDADSGKYLWHYQVNPRDSWDYDATQQMTLAKLTIGGKERRVLMQAPKNGFFYVIDRDSGKLISAGEIAKQNWAERIDVENGRPVERTNIRHENGRTLIYPSGVGAHSWMRMAFSPKTGLVYVPTMQHGFTFYKGKAEGDDLHVGGLGIGDAPPQPGDGKGTLVAYDPVTQKIRWKAPNATMFNGGTAVTGGNLVFQGTADGWFRAYDAGTGKELWKHYVGMGIIAAPSVWSAGGKQYVSVLAGYGGSVAAVGGPAIVGWKYAQPRRLVTYTLGGKAVIPNPAKRTMKVDVVEIPGEKLDAKSVAMGKNLWIACGACHGKGLRAAGGPAPDLRESAIPADAEAFKTLLKEGTLIERGMPRFTLFGDTVIEGLRQYIRFEAQAEAARQKKTKGKRS